MPTLVCTNAPSWTPNGAAYVPLKFPAHFHVSSNEFRSTFGSSSNRFNQVWFLMAQNDAIAPVASHAEPFYQSLPATLDKAYLELAGADHLAPNSANTTIAKYSIAWLKRFVDNDTRYERFLCPRPSAPAISEYRDTCPHST